MKVKNVKGVVVPLVVLSGFVFSNMAQADPVMIKAYKQVYPEAHPKCVDCHSVPLPKKAEGQHDWNAYGTALKKAVNEAGVADVPTMGDTGKISDVVKKVGKIEDFKAK